MKSVNMTGKSAPTVWCYAQRSRFCCRAMFQTTQRSFTSGTFCCRCRANFKSISYIFVPAATVSRLGVCRSSTSKSFEPLQLKTC